MYKRITLLLVALCSVFFLYAQREISGKIYNAETDSVITNVSIVNLKKNKVAISDKWGFYQMEAEEGDTLIFSAVGFTSLKLKVEHHMLLIPENITLQVNPIELQGVTVESRYSLDSLERRNFYKDIYNQKGLTGGNRPSNGVGISLSLSSIFSKEAKQKRKLKKKLQKQEKEIYVDYVFSAKWVATLTGLQGDSLNLFMYRYRPSYKFCRKSNRQQLTLYVNEKFKEFKRLKNK